MSILRVCDECGAPATATEFLETGRVLIDGVDNNTQGCDLCEAHRPLVGGHQPYQAQRVRFYWPGMESWNNETEE